MSLRSRTNIYYNIKLCATEKNEARGGSGERGLELESMAKDTPSEVTAEQRLKQHEKISHAEGSRQTGQMLRV